MLHLLDIATQPSDDADTKLLKRLQVAMAVASVPMIGTWGLTFVAMGHPELVFWHLLYCGGTITLLAITALTHNIRVLRGPHLLLVMCGPFAMHWSMGGYLASGGAFLWCFLSPMASVMFQGVRRSLPWFGGILLLAVLSAFRHGTPVLSPAQIAFQFSFNTVGLVGFMFFSMRFFVGRLEDERARSERLLLNVLPAPIAARLKKEERTIADRFTGVTVLFADIVGFTPLSAKMQPEELVALLDEIFSAFDAIADEHGLEKIKTIGDAYMAACGLPVPRDDHAKRVARAAMAMNAFLRDFATARGFDVSMRIGLHTGQVVAGVIGKRKFTYDLWGDTVNTASRMESHGASGRIHLSDETARALGGAFELEERGVVNVKGKGELRTHWLVREKIDVAPE
jgi:guanylate cyclase